MMPMDALQTDASSILNPGADLKDALASEK